MRELVEGKNTIGRPAAVLKKPYEATFNLFKLRSVILLMLHSAELRQLPVY